MKKHIYLLGTPVDNLTMQETLDMVDNAILTNQHLHHTVVNAGKIVAMHENAELRESVVNADLINADGQAVVWASKILGAPLKERVGGIDLMEMLVARAHEKRYRIFFFGAREEIVKKVVSRYSLEYGPDI